MTAVVSELANEAGASVSAVCRALGCSRSGVYARRRATPGPRARDTAALDVEIAAVHKEHEGRYGSPRVHSTLKTRGHKVGKNRVARRMRALGIRGRRPKRFRRTTDSAHAFPVAPNILDRRFSWDQPNVAWVGDVTFIWTAMGWVYLAILVDLCTRRIVGWATSTRCDTELVLRALNAAVARHRPARGLIHHSDRGSTYASHDYRARLDELGMIASMSRVGNCWDNAVAESTIGSIKIESLDGWIPSSIAELNTVLFRYIEAYYNPRRLHSSLAFRSPIDAEVLFTQERQVA
jgi:transposase InsO family protein